MKKVFRSRRWFFLPLLLLSAIIYAQISREAKKFAPAEDFPREALVYLQIEDLPAALRLWNESKLKSDYLASRNYAEFSENHLALKLTARFEEIAEATGFSLDSEVLAGFGEKRAAIALYDIGKIEFVFIAPMSAEKIAATAFFLNAGNFEKIKLEDETIVYRKTAEIDRGRQSQQILFANFRGRLIVATSEKHFSQTLENIKGKTPANRLSEAPDFRRLAEKTVPHLAVVWFDQTKLNPDWYFKRYWLMSNVEELKNLRAGMCDFELQADRLVEKRVFLTAENAPPAALAAVTAKRLTGMIPAEVPFFKIEAQKNDELGALIVETLFENEALSPSPKDVRRKKHRRFEDWGNNEGYSYLGSEFERRIDENEEEATGEIDAQATPQPTDELNDALRSAAPRARARLFSPRTFEEPLFFEERKALIISLADPAQLDRRKLEKILSQTSGNLYTTGAPNADFGWENVRLGSSTARRMKLASLGWSVFYAVSGRELIFTNDVDLLREILRPRQNGMKTSPEFDEYSVIRLNKRENAFDRPWQMLRETPDKDDEPQPDDFFADNVASLLDVLKNVEQIEFRRGARDDFVFERIDFALKPPGKRPRAEKTDADGETAPVE